MRNVLGAQRIAILFGLVVLNGLLASAVFLYVQPEKTQKERQLKSLNSKVSSLRKDVDNLKLEFEQLDAQRQEFEELRETGFFDKQGRREAEIILSDVQKRSGVIRAVASISGGTFETNALAEKADHKILRSVIDVQVDALTDMDVFNYLNFIKKSLPGHISVDSIDLEREADISRTVLRSIASGGNPPLVSANIQMVWRTMIPDQRDEGDGG